MRLIQLVVVPQRRQKTSPHTQRLIYILQVFKQITRVEWFWLVKIKNENNIPSKVQKFVSPPLPPPPYEVCLLF